MGGEKSGLKSKLNMKVRALRHVEYASGFAKWLARAESEFIFADVGYIFGGARKNLESESGSLEQLYKLHLSEQQS